ncbi:MAG: hypothetical protein U5P41_15540 [Gammaproteobacteria bacterium]|nr:hypothetical protein [Gammaproteobacteria bacterium]
MPPRKITQNRIPFDERLKNRFSAWFEKYKSGNDVDEPSQPFFYLESSGFWHHQPKSGHEEEYRKRVKDRNHGGPGILSRIVDYACLDQELFEFMQSPVGRAAIRNALLENLDDMGRRFQQWAAAIGKSDKTIRNYVGAINGSISTWVRDEGLLDHGLLENHFL